jgi:hypothetical protein
MMLREESDKVFKLSPRKIYEVRDLNQSEGEAEENSNHGDQD